MKNKRNILILLLLLLGLTLSACSGRSFIPTSWPGITVQEDTLYVAYNNHIYTVNASGREESRIPEEADRALTFFAPPSLTADGQLVVGSYNNQLYSFDPQSGRENWVFPNNNRFIAGLLEVDGLTIAPNADGQVYAVDANGQNAWTFSPNEDPRDNKPIFAAPVMNGDNLYVVSMDHFLYALDPATGSLSWKLDLGGTAVSTGILSEDQSMLYIGTFESVMLGIDIESQSIAWEFKTDEWVWASPTLVDGILYFGDLGGTLYALDTTSPSDPVWTLSTDGSITGAPLVTEDTIYTVTEGGTFYAVNLEGIIRWTETGFGEDAKLYGSPIALGDLIVFSAVDADALLIAYTTNGQAQWQYMPEN
jgi:outer membrane protein assembly factor BamB